MPAPPAAAASARRVPPPFALQGPVEILGIGNGHPADVEAPRDAGHAALPVRVRVSAPGPAAAELAP
jgi:beta-galactosidase